MKRLSSIALFLCLLAIGSQAQTVTPTPAPTNTANFAAAGISFNPGASPSIAGTGLYARSLSSSGTYAFTVVDALPASLKPFTVDTAVSAGVAQKVFSIGTANIYVPTAAGVSYTGKNTGWAWSTSALASIPIKTSFRFMPNVRLLKSSVSGSGYQVIAGVLFGWGW